MTKRIWKSFELKPVYDRQKSFYKKAYVLVDEDGNWYLESYGTMVCGMTYQGEFERYWGGYSVTTMRHIKEFIYQWYDRNCWDVSAPTEYANAMNKKKWLSISVY